MKKSLPVNSFTALIRKSIGKFIIAGELKKQFVSELEEDDYFLHYDKLLSPIDCIFKLLRPDIQSRNSKLSSPLRLLEALFRLKNFRRFLSLYKLKKFEMLEVLTKSELICCGPQTTIYYQNTEPTNYYLLLYGRVQFRLYTAEEIYAISSLIGVNFSRRKKQSIYIPNPRTKINFIKRGKNDNPNEISEPGTFFGERNLLYYVPYETSAIAADNCAILSIPIKIFDQFFKHNLARYTDDIREFIFNVIPVFDALDKKQFENYYISLEKLCPPTNTVVYEEDELADSFYLVYRGKCVLEKKGIGEFIFMGKGEICGSESIVLPDKEEEENDMNLNSKNSNTNTNTYLLNNKYDKTESYYLYNNTSNNNYNTPPVNVNDSSNIRNSGMINLVDETPNDSGIIKFDESNNINLNINNNYHKKKDKKKDKKKRESEKSKKKEEFSIKRKFSTSEINRSSKKNVNSFDENTNSNCNENNRDSINQRKSNIIINNNEDSKNSSKKNSNQNIPNLRSSTSKSVFVNRTPSFNKNSFFKKNNITIKQIVKLKDENAMNPFCNPIKTSFNLNLKPMVIPYHDDGEITKRHLGIKQRYKYSLISKTEDTVLIKFVVINLKKSVIKSILSQFRKYFATQAKIFNRSLKKKIDLNNKIKKRFEKTYEDRYRDKNKIQDDHEAELTFEGTVNDLIKESALRIQSANLKSHYRPILNYNAINKYNNEDYNDDQTNSKDNNKNINNKNKFFLSQECFDDDNNYIQRNNFKPKKSNKFNQNNTKYKLNTNYDTNNANINNNHNSESNILIINKETQTENYNNNLFNHVSEKNITTNTNNKQDRNKSTQASQKIMLNTEASSNINRNQSNYIKNNFNINSSTNLNNLNNLNNITNFNTQENTKIQPKSHRSIAKTQIIYAKDIITNKIKTKILEFNNNANSNTKLKEDKIYNSHTNINLNNNNNNKSNLNDNENLNYSYSSVVNNTSRPSISPMNDFNLNKRNINNKFNNNFIKNNTNLNSRGNDYKVVIYSSQIKKKKAGSSNSDLVSNNLNFNNKQFNLNMNIKASANLYNNTNNNNNYNKNEKSIITNNTVNNTHTSNNKYLTNSYNNISTANNIKSMHIKDRKYSIKNKMNKMHPHFNCKVYNRNSPNLNSKNLSFKNKSLSTSNSKKDKTNNKFIQCNEASQTKKKQRFDLELAKSQFNTNKNLNIRLKSLELQKTFRFKNLKRNNQKDIGGFISKDIIQKAQIMQPYFKNKNKMIYYNTPQFSLPLFISTNTEQKRYENKLN